MKLIRKYFLSFICLFLSGVTFAQMDTYFWFVVPEVSTTSSNNGDRPISLSFTAGSTLTYVTITQPANPSFSPIVQGVPANFTVKVDITSFIDSLENKPANSILNRGLLITATAPVSAFFEVNGTANGEIFTLKGRQALGNSFFIPSQNQYENNSTITPTPYSSFDMVATVDNTVVTITPSHNINGHAAGSPFAITLNRGQTYSAVATSQTAVNHLYGSAITSTKPIAVTVKDDYVKPPFGTGTDLEGDQIVPVNITGKNFVAVKGLLTTDDYVYIIATKNGTGVYINGSSTPLVTLSAGAISRYALSSAVAYIRTSEPAYLWHETGSGSDMAGTMLPEIGCTGSNSITAFRTGSGSLYAMLITNVANIGGFRVNGTTIPSSSFSAVTGYTNIQYARIDLSSMVTMGDTITITNTIGLFQGGILQSGATGTKYSFFSGYSNSYLGPDIQLCTADVAVLDGGADKSAYLWSTSATSRTINVSAAGTYWVRTVQGSCTMYDTIVVSSIPKPTAGFTRTNDTIQCFNGNFFTFQNTSTIPSGNMSYLWSFGDGTTSAMINPTHTYSTPGAFNVTLVASTIDGCRSSISKTVYIRVRPTVSFSINDTNQCESGNRFQFSNSSNMLPTPLGGTIASYKWYFGDGNTSVSPSPIYQYATQGSYNVYLTAVTSFGCRDSVFIPVTVVASPKAIFSTIDTAQCLSTNSFVFTSSSTASPGYLTAQDWDFGDMSIDTGTSVSHSYSGNGNYRVKLVVTSNIGCMDSMKKTVIVMNTPIPDFSILDSSQCLSGNSFVFLNKSTAPMGSTYLWDFGDSTTSSLMGPPPHHYSSLGTKNVKLVVSAGSCRDSITKQMIINPSPNASFNINTTKQCLGNNLFMLSNTSTYSGPGQLSYLWLFDDGDSARTKDTMHVYTIDGTYNIKMLATAVTGCTDSSRTTVTVYKNPKPDFTRGPDTAQCIVGNEFKFVNKSVAGTGALLLWNFGDGDTSTKASPTHSYKTSGTFTVTLTVTTANNCVDSIKKDAIVVPKPDASFTVNDTIQCFTGNKFDFTNTTPGGASVFINNWSFGDTSFAGSKDAQHSYLYPGTFQVRLLVQLNSGCSDSIIKTMIVYPMPKAKFSVSDTVKCLDTARYYFTDLSTNPGTSLTWLWKFGDGKTSIIQNPAKKFILNGIYEVTLVITNNDGCVDSTKLTIVSAPIPSVAFKNYDSLQCFDRNLFHFTNTTNVAFGSMSYLWRFGDGDTSTATNPMHHYSTIDTFQVGLIATSNYGCKDSFYWHTYLKSGARPVAAFTVNDSTQCLAGNNFIFTNGSTISSGAIAKQIWSFGDGDTSHKNNINHNYKVPGLKTSKLIVISDQDCIDSTMHTMFIDDKPKAAFTVNDSIQCFNVNRFAYTNKTTITTGSYKLKWDFDDGTTDTTINPIHKFNVISMYNVKLVAVSNLGCSDSVTHISIITPLPVSNFDITTDTVQCLGGNMFGFSDKSTISGGSISMNIWRFGDGGYATSTATATHAYTKSGYFTVKLINITDNMCYDTVQKTVHVLSAPKAAFAVNDSAQCFTANNFIFTNNSTDPSGPLTYLWKFGDGVTSTTPAPNHSYATQGVYTVTLIATSSKGCIDSVKKIMSVFNKPTAGFTVNNTDQCLKGNLFSFTNSTTPIMPGINFLWNFGNGDTSTAVNPSYPYPATGSFTVKLKTVTSQNCDDSISKTINVYASPKAGFTVNDTTQCLSANIFNFTNSSTIASGTFNNNWKVGNGNSFATTDVSYTYPASGKYTVTLITTSNNNCIDSVKHDAYVDAGPKTDFTVNDSSQCLNGNSFQFTNATFVPVGTVISGYIWNFGDGNSSAITTPTPYSYTATDTFTVKLVALTAAGCNDSIEKPVFVRPMPKADFSINLNPQDIVGNNFIFTNLSTVPYGNYSSVWHFGDGVTSLNPNPSNSYAAIDTYTVKLTVTSDYGCTDSTTQLAYLTTSANPTMKIDFAYKNACVGDSVAFENKSTISATDSFKNFFWEFGDTTQTIIRKNPQHMYQYPVTYVVKLRGVSWGGMQDSISYNVTINPKPKLVITFTPDTVAYIGNKITLTGTGTFDNIDWSTGEQSVAIMVEKTGIYSAKIINSNGCTDSSSISVRFKEAVKFVFMTVFTPNGDGYNDFWKVENIDKYQPCKVSIYNRWGDILFTVNDYKNDWDGKYEGKILPEGTYYFVLEAKDGKVYKGAVNIIK